MGERVTISYRGTAYELGRGRHSYGIWAVGAPRTQPVERWPETPEGWNAAWSRFTGIEQPSAIVAASSSASASAGLAISASSALAAALLGIGILCGLVGLFPHYLDGQSIASQSVLLVPHAIYLGVWALSAVLILLGDTRQRAGALLGLGASFVTFGLLFTDLGQVIADGGAGAGLWFTMVGWLAAAVGSTAALFIKSGDASLGRPDRPRGYEAARAVIIAVTGIGVAVAFAPSWDSYLLRVAANGSSTSVTAGNAFSEPGAMIAGNLITMIAFGLVVIAAGLWRPLKLGAALLAGAAIPMVAQGISALIQVSQPTPPGTFGISSSEASAEGLTITNGLTPAFWIYVLLLVVLIVSCAWMLMPMPEPAMATATASYPGTSPYPGTAPYPSPAAAPAPAAAPTETPASAWDEADDFDDDDIDWGTPTTATPVAEAPATSAAATSAETSAAETSAAETDILDSHEPAVPEQARPDQPPADE